VREDPEVPVFQCGYCLVQYIEPHFTDLKDYYVSEYREQHSEAPGAPESAEDRYQAQAYKMKRSAEAIKGFIPEGGNILEIGCSAGGLLAHLENSYELYGAEWNEEDAAFVREAGIPVESGDISEVYPGKTFTGIVAIQVIEHQPDPVGFLRQIKERLIGGGYLYMETPNVDDALLSQYDIPEFADFWYRQPHITYWNAHSMASLLTWLGFEARIDWVQRYGLATHMNWLQGRGPMKDLYAARKYMKPVDPKKRSASALNRVWTKLDHEYRVQLRTLYACDTITVKARLRQI
jgi:SAM-dependent methyltransferase